MQEIRIILVGVGGQGILFTTKVLAQTALRLGHAVIGSETHGMSQRGGSVISHLKIGGQSPLVRRGTADILIALNEIEAYQALAYLREGGTCFANAPLERFPDDRLKDTLAQKQIACFAVNADAIALEFNAPPVANSALLGFVAAHDAIPFSFDQIAETVRLISHKKFRSINRQALERGAQKA